MRRGVTGNTTYLGTQDLGHSFSQYGPPGQQITYMYVRRLRTWLGGYKQSHLTCQTYLLVITGKYERSPISSVTFVKRRNLPQM